MSKKSNTKKSSSKKTSKPALAVSKVDSTQWHNRPIPMHASVLILLGTVLFISIIALNMTK